MKDRLLLFAKTAVTAALLYMLYSEINVQEFVGLLGRINPGWIAAAVALHWGTFLWSVDRWRTILASFNIHAPAGRLARITFIGAFFSLFLPSLVGGDFFRAFYLGRDQKTRLTTTLTSVILDRSIGFVALLILGTVFASFRSVSVQGVRIFPSVAALTGLFIAANVFILSDPLHRWLDGFLRRRRMDRAVERLDAVAEGLRALGRNPAALARTLAVSFGIQLTVVVMVWLVGIALELRVPFIYFLIFVPVVNIITMVPLTINGLGLREGAFYLLFGQVGVSREACISLGLLYYLVVVLSALPGGVLYSLYKKQDHLDQPMQEFEAQ